MQIVPSTSRYRDSTVLQLNLDISKNTVESRYLEVDGTIFTSSTYPKCKLICTSGNLDLLKSSKRQILVGESNQNVFLIQIDSSKFAEFEISEFETSKFDCTKYQVVTGPF